MPLHGGFEMQIGGGLHANTQVMKANEVEEYVLLTFQASSALASALLI